MFNNIPDELKSYRQWINWRAEDKGGPKLAKLPYMPNNKLASVTNPETWTTFDAAVAAASNFSGIGFVFTKADPYAVVDLDDTHGDQGALEDQKQIFAALDSYSEISPSGNGLHIIVKATIPQGRRRSFVEVYDDQRYMTFTGNVYHNRPIFERQAIITEIWKAMGAQASTVIYGQDQEQKQTDEEILAVASTATNADKFQALYVGNWQTLYPSQSEADFALVDIIAFYTQNREQIARIFRASALGQREKADRDKYIAYMVEKSFDRQLPPIDCEGLRVQFNAMVASKEAAAAPQEKLTAAAPMPSPGNAPDTVSALTNAPSLPSHDLNDPSSIFPPGLVGQIAEFMLAASPRPVREISLAGAIGLLSGITGKAFNTPTGAGLNQYILVLAATGRGKDAVADGASKLMAAIRNGCPASTEFIGPGELVSSAGIIKWLSRFPSIVSIVGEFALKMQAMASPNANSHMQGLKATLLQLYSKSDGGSVLAPMAYSDKANNTPTLYSPALTIVGECVPSTFYQMLDEKVISDGLLPRFTLFEYIGRREYLNESAFTAKPSIQLCESLSSLAAQCLTLNHNNTVQTVVFSPEAEKIFKAFEKWTTDTINTKNSSEVYNELWNRAHMKALKLASLVAVGVNWHFPVVDGTTATWATNLITDQVRKLCGKFERGEVGESVTNEAKQLSDIERVIGRYMTCLHEDTKKYGGTFEMHRDGVITSDHIQKRVVAMASFRADRMGATFAIKRALAHLLEVDALREIPKTQMQMTYGRSCRAFAVADPDRFIEAL